MKGFIRLVLMLVITGPVWGAKLADQFSDHKPYEEMNTEELKQEEIRLRELLVKIATRVSGIAIQESSGDSTGTPPSDVNAKSTKSAGEMPASGSVHRKKSKRVLREARKRASERTRQPMDEETYRQFQHWVFRDEVEAIEKENRQQYQREKSAPPQQETHRQDSQSSFSKSEDAESLKEYVIELPLASDNPNREKQRIKVKLKPGVIPLLKKKHELNKMLIDDVVRLTGKSLK